MADAEFEKFIEDIKDRADILTVIETTSEYRFEHRKVGRYIYCKHPDSLAVDQDWGIYTWFSKTGQSGHQFETGDVFSWLQRYANMEFWQAATWLADRYGIKIPERKGIDPAKERERRTRSEIYEAACTWFEEALWKTPAAIEYAHSRGFTDETIRKARLGFSGGLEMLQDLIGTLNMYQVNLDDPAAVALVGKRGGVAAWLHEHNVPNANSDWAEDDRIWGLATFPRLVYPHIWRGRVVYFSARNLEWSEDKKSLVGRDKPKSYNIPSALVGERFRYFNPEFTRGAKNCLVVEGQADALSLAQWGFPAIALVGVGADEGLAELLKNYKVERIFVALDNDKEGQKNQVKTAMCFGPMTRLVTWDSLGTTQDKPIIDEAEDDITAE